MGKGAADRNRICLTGVGALQTLRDGTPDELGLALHGLDLQAI